MSNQAQSLDDVFNGVEEEPVEAVEEVTEEPETTTAEQEPTQEPEKEPEPEVPAASVESENESWTKTAVLDERRKRQALEAELVELKKAQEEPVKAPDVIDDQEGFTRHFAEQMAESNRNLKIEMSQNMMRMFDPEYDAKEAEFIDLARDNPQLGQQLSEHSMPAKFVVETVNKARELKKLENVDEYKAQLRAEMEAEIRKELGAELESKKANDDKVASIKPSLANARASKNQGEPTNESLGDLFGR